MQYDQTGFTTNVKGTYIVKKYKKRKKKGYEKVFEKIIVENFPNMEKEIINQFQEA